MSIPIHHLITAWSIGGSRWSPKPSDGVTESQDAAWGAEIESKRALSGNRAELNIEVNRWSSSLLESSDWDGEDYDYDYDYDFIVSSFGIRSGHQKVFPRLIWFDVH